MQTTRPTGNPFKTALTLTCGALLCAMAGAAHAQAYPNKTVRIVVAYPPGGPTDLIGRLIAQKMSDNVGQQFVIDNRAGSNGVIGSESVVRAAPDGYTLLLGTSSLASNANIYTKLPYDANKDLLAIHGAAVTPYFLGVNASLPINSVKDLIAYAKERPGQVNFGSAGNGSGPHLSGEMFNMDAGVKTVHVPYKGTSPAVVDLVAGRVQYIFVGLPAMQEFVKAGRIRLLAVAEGKRSPLMPDLPTVAEAGVPGFESSAWFAYFAPAGLPRDIRGKLSTEIAKALNDKPLTDRILGMGAAPMNINSEQLEAYFKQEAARYTKLIRDAKIKMD